MKTPVIYDTMSRALTPLQAQDGKTFRFYCCGPTVYGPAHIGNFRTFLIQDVLRRVIEASGQPTLHVRNITDVDDKTIRQSQEEGKSLAEFTTYWLDRFHADCEALNMLQPHVEPSAVDHIPQQIRLIEQLVKGNHAYATPDGSVYFRVQSFDAYGRLSKLNEREISTPAAGQVQDADEYDRETASDFVLWKAQKPEDGPNVWASPWGPGRPGWHVECSAMSMEYLGETFDLHGGGVDLIFPHHENEIAQSEAATKKPFARIWFHSAHLMADGHKMSKSLGNLHTLDDVKKQGFSAMDLRYVMISGHYRQPLNFTWESLHASQAALRKLSAFQERLEKAASSTVTDASDWGPFEPAYDALADNLNTPDALGKLFSAINGLDKTFPDTEVAKVYLGQWRRIMHVFGFTFESTLPTNIPADVAAMAHERWEAKQARDFAKADTLRKALTEKGWTIRDSKSGYEVLPAE